MAVDAPTSFHMLDPAGTQRPPRTEGSQPPEGLLLAVAGTVVVVLGTTLELVPPEDVLLLELLDDDVLLLTQGLTVMVGAVCGARNMLPLGVSMHTSAGVLDTVTASPGAILTIVFPNSGNSVRRASVQPLHHESTRAFVMLVRGTVLLVVGTGAVVVVGAGATVVGVLVPDPPEVVGVVVGTVSGVLGVHRPAAASSWGQCVSLLAMFATKAIPPSSPTGMASLARYNFNSCVNITVLLFRLVCCTSLLFGLSPDSVSGC
jgi:hypothetical protein